MPNQRAKDRVFLGVFLPDNLKQDLRTAASQLEITVSKLVTILLAEGLGRRVTKQPAPLTGTRENLHSEIDDRVALPQPTSESPEEEIWML